jgi:hypothetical protein
MSLTHNQNITRRWKACGAAPLICWCAWWQCAAAQNPVGAKSDKTAAAPRARSGMKAAADDTPTNVLSSEEWKRVDTAVDRALNWMAAQQQEDGSFPSLETGQPAVTSLCMMAFISHGHSPGNGELGARLERATDFVLSCQKESGILAKVYSDDPEISRAVNGHIGTCTAYDHAISSLLLTELYGTSEPQRAKRMEGAIKKALAATLVMQRWPKDKVADKGGWRYIDDRDESDSDLSLTGWSLMFLRSARNAGFDVPKQAIDDAVAYIRRCYSKKYGTFEYWIDRMDGRTRGTAGAGILALAHAGYHNSEEATSTGAWILKQSFENYNRSLQNPDTKVVDRYHYSLFNCCQGMYQLGGKYWQEFFPRIVPVLLANQQSDGSWPADSYRVDARFGNSYTTALVVITLGAPNQLLPIFQR